MEGTIRPDNSSLKIFAHGQFFAWTILRLQKISPNSSSPGIFFAGQFFAQFFLSKAENSSPEFFFTRTILRLDNFSPGQFLAGQFFTWTILRWTIRRLDNSTSDNFLLHFYLIHFSSDNSSPDDSFSGCPGTRKPTSMVGNVI
jgi:hypothetical protein